MMYCALCGQPNGHAVGEPCPEVSPVVDEVDEIDEVESPAHYMAATDLFVHRTDDGNGSGPYWEQVEVADVLEAYGLESSGHLWNVGKYILRAGHKRKPNESFEAAYLRDLKKAAWYLRRKIQRLENQSGNEGKE